MGFWSKLLGNTEPPSRTELQERYSSMSSDKFAELERNNLTDDAKEVYDEEKHRRKTSRKMVELSSNESTCSTDLRAHARKTTQQEDLADFVRLAAAVVYATFRCDDGFATAVLSEPIRDKQSLKNVLVDPNFKYRKIGDKEFLFIELKFPDLDRQLVIGAEWSDDTMSAFLRAASVFRQFWVNDGPIADYMSDGIPIPVVKPEMLDELLDDIASMKR